MTTPQQFKEAFKASFTNVEYESGKGFKPSNELNLQQLWLLVKLCKHVRLRARNNAAFNNLFNNIFGDYATFRQVTKTRKDGSTYPGLSITLKSNPGVELAEEEEE